MRASDFASLLAVRNAVAPDQHETEGELRHLDTMLRARGLEPMWLVALLDERLVGYGDVVGTGGAQGVQVGVIPEARRRGIGTALWERAAAVLRERGACVARTLWVDDANEPARAFLRRHGFREAERAWTQSLDVVAFDPARLVGCDDALVAQGFALTTLAAEGAGDVGVLRRVHDLHGICLRDLPRGGEPVPPPSFEGWVAQTMEAPGSVPDAFFLAKVGDEYVGMTWVERTGQVGVLKNGFTGVLPAYRGRGIARALKLRAIAFARDHGYGEIRTSNHAANGPMLRVNELLGFRKTSGKAKLERDLAAQDFVSGEEALDSEEAHANNR